MTLTDQEWQELLRYINGAGPLDKEIKVVYTNHIVNQKEQ